MPLQIFAGMLSRYSIHVLAYDNEIKYAIVDPASI